MIKKKGATEELAEEKEAKAPFFQRVGEFVTNNYKIILIVWLIVLGGAIYPAIRLSGVLSYNEAEFLPDDLEFHQGQAIYEELFPSNSTGTTIIVIQSTDPISSTENLAYIEELTNRIYQNHNSSIYELQSILTVYAAYNASYWTIFDGTDPNYPPPDTIDDIPNLLSKWVLSGDKRTSLILITYDAFGKTADEIDAMIKENDIAIGELAHVLKDEMDLQNTEVYHTGDQYVSHTWVAQAQKDASLIDIFTIVFVLVILLVVFCSIVAPLIPLIAIGSSIAVSFAILYAISFGMEIHFLATLFLTVTSLGAGVDYCIFIFSRYDEERKKGHEKKEALITAIKFAGESVFHSGLTVMIGFGAMIIPNFPLLRILGISMCIGISISMLSALLVVPSIIMLLGDAVWWPRILQTILRPQKWFKKRKNNTLLEESKEDRPDGKAVLKVKEQEKEEKPKFILRFANFVTKNGLAITITSLVVASPFVYFAITMDTSTDFMGMLPKDFEGTEGRNILSESMSVGDPTSINVLIHNLNQSPLDLEIREETAILCHYFLRIDNVRTVRSTVQPLGILMIDAIEGPFADYCYSFVGNDNKSLIIEIYFAYSPYAKETEQFVSELPDTVAFLLDDRGLEFLSEGEVEVLGFARGLYEIKLVTDNSYPIVIPVVIIGVYLVLFFLFGSYFTPIRLILTIALSIVVTLGLLQLVFSLGFSVPIFWLLPIMLFSILMGLGLDYDIFLVSRIKEYYDKGMSNKEAIAHSLDHTASIITSCGTVMAVAYSSLLISQLWHLRELGFAFAIAIILDATVIRLIVVPAIMVLMEKLNWIGPKRLMKARHHHAPVPSEEPKETLPEEI